MIDLLAAKTRTGDAIARRVIAAQTLYAPYVLDGEVISALLGLMRGQKISEREADAALSNYRAFPVERQDVLPLWPHLKSPVCRTGAVVGGDGGHMNTLPVRFCCPVAGPGRPCDVSRKP